MAEANSSSSCSFGFWAMPVQHDARRYMAPMCNLGTYLKEQKDPNDNSKDQCSIDKRSVTCTFTLFHFRLISLSHFSSSEFFLFCFLFLFRFPPEEETKKRTLEEEKTQQGEVKQRKNKLDADV